MNDKNTDNLLANVDIEMGKKNSHTAPNGWLKKGKQTKRKMVNSLFSWLLQGICNKFLYEQNKWKNNLKHEADEIEQESLPNKHHLKIKRKKYRKT